MKKLLLLFFLIATATNLIAHQNDALPARPATGFSTHVAILAGAWLPQGNLSIVGTHPYCGFQLGVRNKRISVNGTAAFKFLRSANDYLVLKDNVLYSTHKFIGEYFGVDGGFNFLLSGRHELSALAGCAFDGFEALSIENSDGKKSIRAINSLNMNAGLGYKFYTSLNGGYVGLDMKYNFLFYKNKGGTDLSGNVITLGLAFGFWRRNP